MELNYEKMVEAERQRAKERNQNFKDAVDAIHNRNQGNQEFLNRLGRKIAEESKAKMQQEIEAKTAEESEAAREAVRAKYAKEMPQEWNDSSETKALRRLLQNSLRGK